MKRNLNGGGIESKLQRSGFGNLVPDNRWTRVHNAKLFSCPRNRRFRRGLRIVRSDRSLIISTGCERTGKNSWREDEGAKLFVAIWKSRPYSIFLAAYIGLENIREEIIIFSKCVVKRNNNTKYLILSFSCKIIIPREERIWNVTHVTRMSDETFINRVENCADTSRDKYSCCLKRNHKVKDQSKNCEIRYDQKICSNGTLNLLARIWRKIKGKKKGRRRSRCIDVFL